MSVKVMELLALEYSPETIKKIAPNLYEHFNTKIKPELIKHFQKKIETPDSKEN